MNMQKTGQLIRRLREARGITQKALAEKLHVTDKAVSKWERSLSCPDVALLEPLAGQLGISVEELLQGELFPEEQAQGTPLGEKPFSEFSLQPPRALHTSHGPHVLHSLQKYASCACTLLFCLAGGICAVCDLAVFGAFTWSLYPIASLIFAWAVLSPLLRHGRKGIRGSLVSLSLSIFPFLFALAWLLHMPPLFLPVGFSVAAIGLAFLWGICLILRQFAQRKLFAFALCSLLAVFVFLAVNLVLSRLIQTPFLDEWDMLPIAIFLCLTVFFLQLDRKRACRTNASEMPAK